MKHRHFTVSVPNIPGVRETDWKNYINQAVSGWSGGLSASSPFYGVTRGQITVTPQKTVEAVSRKKGGVPVFTAPASTYSPEELPMGAEKIKAFLDHLVDCAISDGQATFKVEEGCFLQELALYALKKTKEADDLLKAEHEVSAAYVRLRVLVGAMNPPVTDLASISAYTEDIVKDLIDIHKRNGQ